MNYNQFEMLITRGYYFIDKTMFIKELLDKKGLVNLFTRPRMKICVPERPKM